MARRQGAFSELLDFSSRLRWQVGVGLAVASAVGFHFAAAAFSVVPKVTTTADLGSNIVQQGIHTLAYFLQFIVPVAFVILATAAALKRSHSGALLKVARADPKIAIASMSWRDFERLVGETFRRQGFTVTGFGGNAPDGGVDLGLSKNGQRFLVQCKHWRKRQVGVTVVRELNGVIAAQRAHGGFVVTGGQFTREAREFADSCAIKLIDGPALDELMGDKPLVRSAPSCPRCGTSMVERKAKQGRFAGQVFWGCRHYPECTEILKIA
jgi:restriction system protein